MEDALHNIHSNSHQSSTRHSNSRQSGLVLQQRFHDIDQIADVINSANRRQLHLSQLSLQRFQCDLLLVEFDDAQFIFTVSSCLSRYQGEKKPGYQPFAFVLEAVRQLPIAHSIQVSENTLFGFDQGREADTTLPDGVVLCNLQIKQSVFDDCLQIMERSDIGQRRLATNFLHAPATLPTVRQYLRQLQHLIEHQPQFLKLPHLKTLVLEDFIPLLIDAIPPANQTVHPPPVSNRAKLVKQAEDYLITRLDQPLTLKELCKALNISRSPLFSGFQELFGIGPMAYLKVQRLQAVRRLLKAADPTTDSVTLIANRFGFWSAGHFARNYKQMFGELPSETFNRSD
jgi:AraC family transcriptional regulator, ethanolamine operon transcriptional activator